MKKNKWDDAYARRARTEKYLARSVYKLQEIDKKYRIIREGFKVLDLGCFPGSWSQYAIEKAGPGGEVAGVDVTRPGSVLSPGFTFIQGDVLDMDVERLARDVGTRDLVLSDLAPATTGIRSTDAVRSTRLAGRALEIALKVLRTGGHFVCKVFEGQDLKPFKEQASGHFQQIRLFRPSAVRKGSREVYIIGLSTRRRM